MSEKYKGKYRNESARLHGWDYSSNASYFITICTQDREHFFGEIKNGRMRVSPAGAIAHVLWYEIKNHAVDIKLGEFAVMPNHIHGILILDGDGGGCGCGDVACNVPTGMAAISPKSNTVASIIRSYKSAVTKFCNQLGLEFAWQSRFHDHIIRNDESFRPISDYIKNNPTKWKEDKFF